MGLDSTENRGRHLTQDEVFGGLFKGGIRFTLAEDFTLKDGRVLKAGGQISFAGLSRGITAFGYGEKMEFIGQAKVISHPDDDNSEIYDVAEFVVED